MLVGKDASRKRHERASSLGLLKLMGISIIIPTKNRKEDLLITLRSIIQQSRLPEEIVIVDQSRKDCKEEILELLRVNGSKLDLIYVWDRDITSILE